MELIVQAIEVIHSKSEWGAEVVYGDTDSLFVYLPGRNKEEAFNIGEDIAATITRMNPQPIKLKFEKVYNPRISSTDTDLGLSSLRFAGQETVRRIQVRKQKGHTSSIRRERN